MKELLNLFENSIENEKFVKLNRDPWKISSSGCPAVVHRQHWAPTLA